MTLYRCQVRLKHQSGFPRDDVSNTFWMESAEGPNVFGKAEQAAEIVRDAYTVLHAPGTSALANFISPVIVATGHEVRVAPIDKATGVDERGEGQPPVHIEVFDFISRVSPTPGSPSEVAMCMSFRNNASSATPPAQRRGRVYIGPIEQASVQARAGSDIPEPIATLANAVRGAGIFLRDQTIDPSIDWVVYSRPFAGRALTERVNKPPLRAIAARAGQTWPVTQVWTDNAFDTQRRRGERATAKVIA